MLALAADTARTWGVVGTMAGLAAAVIAWMLDRRRRAYTDVATTPAAATSAGHVELKGRAWAAEPLLARRTQTPSVWWDYKLEEERRHTRTVTETDSEGRTRTRTETYEQWHTIDTAEAALPALEVVDATGSVTVRLGSARVVPRRTLRETFRDDGRLAGRGLLAKMFDNRTGRYRETERAVAVGDQLFVVGEAVLDERAGVPVVGGGPLVSTRSEDSHTGRLGAAVTALVLVAAAAIGFGLAVAISPTQATPASIGAAVGVPLLLLVGAWLGTAYNRLHLLAQGIERAWSLIDVQLQRRHDLVPALAEVVAAHADHERSVQAGIAEARWQPGGHTAAELEGEAAGQTAALRQLLARAEAHPELEADASFERLQRALADAEGRIAGSRTFYNDSLTLLRNQTQKVPGLLVARFLDLDRRELLRADGFERTVPALERAF